MSIANPYMHGRGIRVETRLKRRAIIASLTVAIILIIAKIFAFLSTNSVSILSSLMDSAFDIMASTVALISITHAARPADEDHRFGHGKIEALGALAQGLFILGSSLFLFIEATRRMVTPQAVDKPFAGIIVMILSIVLTAALVIYQRKIIEKTKSPAVVADQIHYAGDLLMNFCVLLALLLGYFIDWPYFDPLFALFIAARLLYGAGQVARNSFDILLDKEIPESDRQKIIDIVMTHPAVDGIHDLRTRNTGERYFISFHAEMDPGMTIARVHDVMDDLEKSIFENFAKSEVLIHPEPLGIDDHRIDDAIRKKK